MSKKPISFRERLKAARPDVVERQKRNRLKSVIAMKLRVLRDGQGMTQADVAEATGMTRVKISQMEALVGATPSIEDLDCFAVACGGRIEVVISTDKADWPASQSESSPSE